MRLGLIGYSNRSSGIGMLIHDFIDNLPIDSFLSYPSVKGQEDGWHERQHTAWRPKDSKALRRYMEAFKPDAVIFIETDYFPHGFKIVKELGSKPVCVVMHEVYRHWTQIEEEADLAICPSRNALEKAVGCERSVFLPLPIALEPFPYKERGGHTLVHNVGYGWRNDRRQTARVVRAFHSLEDPDARLIVNCQSKWAEGVPLPDERIDYRLVDLPEPADIWAEGDIAIQPTAYEGFGRMPLEAQACGLPCLTMDADPMNLSQNDSDLLIAPNQTYLAPKFAHDTVFNEVSVEGLREKMEWLLTLPMPDYSKRARAFAEEKSWSNPKMRDPWIETLEELCNG